MSDPPPFDPWPEGLVQERLRDLDELRELMRAFGWLRWSPAFKDENGVVMDGHRRLAVAEELGIEPIVTVKRFGRGDKADVRRVQFMLTANTGQSDLGHADRERLAKYLYGDPVWSIERVANALDLAVTNPAAPVTPRSRTRGRSYFSVAVATPASASAEIASSAEERSFRVGLTRGSAHPRADRRHRENGGPDDDYQPLRGPWPVHDRDGRPVGRRREAQARLFP
jgi:hypothetical protein